MILQNSLAVGKMLLKPRQNAGILFFNKSLPMRFISLTEAERVFIQEAKKLNIDLIEKRTNSKYEGSSVYSSSKISQQLSESDLKKVYLQFAKVYHPDVQPSGNKAKFQKLTDAYERIKADKAGYTLTEEDLYDMYKDSYEKAREEKMREEQEEAEKESRKTYKNTEELKQEFEKWKRNATTEYDQDRHDEFLSNRYYKMGNRTDEFNTSSHFSHPGSQAGPRNGPSQNPTDFYTNKEGSPKTIKIKIPGTDGFNRSSHFRGQADAEEEASENRRMAIIFFSVFSSVFLYYWM